MGNFQYKMIIDDIINKINNGELSSEINYHLKEKFLNIIM